MKNLHKGAILGSAAIIALGFATPSFASSTFDFDGAGGASTPTGTQGTDFYDDSGSPQLCTNGDYCSVTNSGGLSFLESGISLNVIGLQDFVSATDYAGASVLEDLRGYDAGLGVTSEGADNDWGFDSSLEQVNYNQGEALLFDFGSQDVSFDSIILNQGAHGACPVNDKCGTFDLWIDGTKILSSIDAYSQSFLGLVGSEFIFVVASASHDLNEDGIYFAGLTVTAVPLPAAAFLMFSALSGAGIMRRRRMKKVTAAVAA